MAQVYDYLDQNSSLPPDNILNLVNERLLKPTDQQRTSKLRNYFLGYKEFLDTPPSPTLSDQDQLFSYLEESSINLDGVSALPASCRPLLENSQEVESQVDLRRTNKSKLDSKNGPQHRKGSQGAERKGKRGCTRSHPFKTGGVVKEFSQSTHQMKTRSRTCARKLEELRRGGGWNTTTAMGLLFVNNDHGYHASHPSDAESHSNKASLGSTPVNITRARRTKNARRQPPRQASTAQRESVRKTRNSKGRLLHILTPPQSE